MDKVQKLIEALEKAVEIDNDINVFDDNEDTLIMKNKELKIIMLL